MPSWNSRGLRGSALEEIKVIDGVIGQNGLSFANSSKLTVDTINRIIIKNYS